MTGFEIIIVVLAVLVCLSFRSWIRYRRRKQDRKQRDYTGAAGQVSDEARIDALKTDVLTKAIANGGFYVPFGYVDDTGVMGSTALHQALRALIAENKLVYDKAYNGWGECWKVPQ